MAGARLYPNALFIREPFKIIEYQELMRLADLRPDDEILDVGCGSGLQTIVMANRCRSALGIDVDRGSIAKARETASFACRRRNVEFSEASACDVDFDRRFDKALSYCVLEHIPDWPGALRRVHRALRPGGRLIISVDSLSSLKDKAAVERHREHNHVQHYFTRAELAEALASAGFVAAEVRPLFTSELAEAMFADIIRSDGYRPLHDVIPYRWLRDYVRLRSRESEGVDPEAPSIFLVARAMRPE
jgi:SAM-dependent methyltransferase